MTCAMSKNITQCDSLQPLWVRTIGFRQVSFMETAMLTNICNLATQKTGVTQADKRRVPNHARSPRDSHTRDYGGCDAA